MYQGIHQGLQGGGFRFREIPDRVELDPDADHILFHSFGTTQPLLGGQNHYIESLQQLCCELSYVMS